MVENSATGTEYLYAPWGGSQVFAAMNGQVVQQAQLPLPGGGVAIYENSTLNYVHPDRLGSERLVSSSTQTMVSDSAYAPFGEQYAAAGSSFYNFTGQQQWTTSGLDDFPFRRYSPVQGRWISPDRAGLAAVDITNPQTWNRYAYVMNNPLANIDPLGLKCGVFHGQPIGCGSFSDAGFGGGDFGDFSGAFSGIWGGGGSGLSGGGGWWAGGGGGPCGAWCAPPASLLGGNAFGACPPGMPNCTVGADNQIYQNQWVPDPNGEPTGSWQLVATGQTFSGFFGQNQGYLSPAACQIQNWSPNNAKPVTPNCDTQPCVRGPEPVKIGPQPKPPKPAAFSCVAAPGSVVPEVPGDPRVDSGEAGNPYADFIAMLFGYAADATNCWSHYFGW
jgi:RHS repeat-associated protein